MKIFLKSMVPYLAEKAIYPMHGDEIKAIRVQLFAFTQAEFADLLGVSCNAVTKWEQGLRLMSPKTVHKLQKAITEKKKEKEK